MNNKDGKRLYGEHLTSSDIFIEFIFPKIKSILNNFTWIDLYAGEGNLIFPILEQVPEAEREHFFNEHIFLSDIQEKMVEECVKRAINLGVNENFARELILLNDNLKEHPEILDTLKHPIYHITNPPYLYLGYIRKHKETEKYLPLFENNENEGYQDLYQIALMNDLRNNIENLIYIIPSNFLFGASGTNKFREDFLQYYNIVKVIIVERQIFEFTGTNICICFFKKKETPSHQIQNFSGVKITKQEGSEERNYTLKPEFKYRAGSEFEEFLIKNRDKKPLTVKYYLLNEEVLKNKGSFEVEVIDANKYQNNQYVKLTINSNEYLKNQINSNILYVRTVDSGSNEGRAGLGVIREDFNVDGIYVSGNTYRTHPIQIFLTPILPHKDQLLLRDYFSLMLEYFRDKLDSEFLTTYKYSNAEYTRKYLGLTQVRSLIETFPLLTYNEEEAQLLKRYIRDCDVESLLNLIRNINKHG